MRSLAIGFCGLVAIAWFITGSGGSAQFFATHSVVLVFGGTLTVLFVGTPWNVLKILAVSLKGLVTAEETVGSYSTDLMALAANRQAKVADRNALMKYSCELWAQGVDADLFVVLLSEKRREIDSKNLDAVQSLKNLTKYPPALGMTGTVVGMIGLFANLDGSRDLIGHNLSLALTATFLGLISTNLVLSPLSDRLQIHQAKMQRLHTHLYELLLLISRSEPKSLIEGEIHGRAA